MEKGVEGVATDTETWKKGAKGGYARGVRREEGKGEEWDGQRKG